jgi:DNA-binding GntR family transcriptional regulator
LRDQAFIGQSASASAIAAGDRDERPTDILDQHRLGVDGSYANSRRIQDRCREHVAIIEAIATGDLNQASAKMRLHLEHALAAMPGA